MPIAVTTRPAVVNRDLSRGGSFMSSVSRVAQRHAVSAVQPALNSTALQLLRLDAAALPQGPEVRLFPDLALPLGFLDGAVPVDAGRKPLGTGAVGQPPDRGDGPPELGARLSPERVLHVLKVAELPYGHQLSSRLKRR